MIKHKRTNELMEQLGQKNGSNEECSSTPFDRYEFAKESKFMLQHMFAHREDKRLT
jgi:hypothetical protein